MNYYLIEQWSSDMEIPEDTQAVALTAEVLYQLEQANISYLTLEDFYISGELRGDTDSFLFNQLAWFKEFDQFLKDHFPDIRELDFNMASFYHYMIKYRVDDVILCSWILKKFIR